MAKKKKVVGSLVNELSFKIDKASWNNIDKFEKKLKSLQRTAKGLNTTIDIKLGKIGKDLQALSGPQGLRGRSQAEVDLSTRLASLKIAEKENKIRQSLNREQDRVVARQQASMAKQDRQVKHSASRDEANQRRQVRQAKQLADARISAEDKVHRQRLWMQRKIEHFSSRAGGNRISSGEGADMMSRFESASAAYIANPLSKAHLSRFKQEVAGVGNEFTKWGGAPRAGLQGLIMGIKSARGQVIALAAIMASIGAGAAFDYTKKFQSLHSSMNFVSGSTEASAENFKWAAGEANRLGIDIEGLAGSFVKLQASSKNQLDTNQVKNLISGFTEYAKVLGASDEKVQLGYYAFANMIDKRYLYAEEVYQQLSEQIPGAASAIETAMKDFGYDGKSGLRNFLQTSKILTKDAIPAISRELHKAAIEGGALEKALGSLESQQNRMMNSWKLNFDASTNPDALKNLEVGMYGVDIVMRQLGETWKHFLASDGLNLFLRILNVIIAAFSDIFSLVGMIGAKISDWTAFMKPWASGMSNSNQFISSTIPTAMKSIAPSQAVTPRSGPTKVEISVNSGELNKVIDVRVDNKNTQRLGNILNNTGVPE